jgi:hypothetical protein
VEEGVLGQKILPRDPWLRVVASDCECDWNATDRLADGLFSSVLWT